MIHTIPDPLQKEIDKYFNLAIGHKNIACPYYINTKITAGNLRVMAGKGSVEEIELETRIWAKVKGFNLEQATEDEIRNFMIHQKIGIDCSGFVVQILEAYTQNTGLKSFISQIQFENTSIIARLRRFLRPVENLGANTLTSDLNCIHINNLNDIRPGDLIRAKGPQKNAHHIAIITKTEFDANGNLEMFQYVNSHRFYGDANGVRYGIVDIQDPTKGLKEQIWQDVHTDGQNYFLQDLLVDYEDNGIRRLKFSNNLF